MHFANTTYQEWSAACKAINRRRLTLDMYQMAAVGTKREVGYTGFTLIHALKMKINKDNEPMIDGVAFEVMMSAYESMRVEHGQDKADRCLAKTLAKSHVCWFWVFSFQSSRSHSCTDA